MNLEEHIRAVMIAHEHEAPTAAEFVPVIAEPRRRTHWLPAVAAAAVVLAVVGTAVAVRQSGDGRHSAGPAPTALACPHAVVSGGRGPDSVPDMPQGVDGTDRLVPLQTPSRAVVCAYLRSNFTIPPTHTDIALTGTAELGGDLSRLTDTLAWLPRTDNYLAQPCRLYLARTDGDAYLIGLTYADGTMWVAAPGNHCVGATNGAFDTPTNLRAFAAAAYAAHKVVPGTASRSPAPHGARGS